MLPKGTTIKDSKPLGQCTSKSTTKPTRRCRSEARTNKTSSNLGDRNQQRKRRGHAPSPNFRLVLRASTILKKAKQIAAASASRKSGSVFSGKYSPSNTANSCREVKPSHGTNGHADVQKATQKRKRDADEFNSNQDETATGVLCAPKRKKIDAIQTVDTEVGKSVENHTAVLGEVIIPNNENELDETSQYPLDNFRTIDHPTMNLDQDLYTPSFFNTPYTIYPNMGTENIDDAQCDAEVAGIMGYNKCDSTAHAPEDHTHNDNNASSSNDQLPYGFTSKPYTPLCFNTTFDKLPYGYNLIAYSPSCLNNALDQLPYGYSLKPYSPTF